MCPLTGWELMARLKVLQAGGSTGPLYASAFHRQIRGVAWLITSVWQLICSFLSFFSPLTIFVSLWLVSCARKALCITALPYLSILGCTLLTCPVLQEAKNSGLVGTRGWREEGVGSCCSVGRESQLCKASQFQRPAVQHGAYRWLYCAFKDC